MKSSAVLNKAIVVDASPLIALGRTNNLHILSKLFGTIIIPEVIAEECLVDKVKPGAIAIQDAIKDKIIHIHRDFKLSNSDDLLDILGIGEATAIKLADSLKLPLIIDEKLGRSTAKKFQIKIIGTAGVLLLAKQRKIIKAIEPIITQLKNAGYYLSDSLVNEMLVRAGEN